MHLKMNPAGELQMICRFSNPLLTGVIIMVNYGFPGKSNRAQNNVSDIINAYKVHPDGQVTNLFTVSNNHCQ